MAVKKNLLEDEELALEPVGEAEAALRSHQAEKPGTYQSVHRQALDDLAGQMLNRKEFSYDPESDGLYQQMVKQYVRQGKMAMEDTLGRAQTMTGGYGNSYAQTASQQAYQGYLQQAADRLPEYYRLARDAYDRQGQDLRDKYDLVKGQEDAAYGRYQDALAGYYAQLDRLQGRYDTERQLQYQSQRDQVADQQWLAEFEEEQRQFNHKQGIRNVDAAAAKKSADQAQWWDWWFNHGGKDEVSDDRKAQIAGWVATSLNKVSSPSFSLDKLIGNSGYLTSDQERQYAQTVGKYIAGIR